jgi:DnaJ-domain-containing protein 1
MIRFDSATVAAVRRLDKVLAHHDSTIKRLHESGSLLEREAFHLLEKRLRRLQGELASVHADRIALIDGLRRLGVDVEQSDAAIGRALRRALGVPRHDRSISFVRREL